MTRRSGSTAAIAEAPRRTTMLLVDCPLCDTASAFDPDDDALDCPHCDVRLEVARDEAWPLAEAA
jgi:hypothetical protein